MAATCKVYVGGLSWDTTDDSLLNKFQEYGNCEAIVIKDRETGRSRGFGFVTFEREEDAEKSLTLNEEEFEGRTVRVSFAKERDSRPPRYSSDRGDSGRRFDRDGGNWRREERSGGRREERTGGSRDSRSKPYDRY